MALTRILARELPVPVLVVKVRPVRVHVAHRGVLVAMAVRPGDGRVVDVVVMAVVADDASGKTHRGQDAEPAV